MLVVHRPLLIKRIYREQCFITCMYINKGNLIQALASPPLSVQITTTWCYLNMHSILINSHQFHTSGLLLSLYRDRPPSR